MLFFLPDLVKNKDRVQGKQCSHSIKMAFAIPTEITSGCVAYYTAMNHVSHLNLRTRLKLSEQK